MKKNKEIDIYIKKFSKDTQAILIKIRSAIIKAAPKAEEAMSYGIPTFKYNGNLVHFGAFKKHIGFFPSPSGTSAFKKELSVYKNTKGSVQFPFDKPIPFQLITKIVKFRVIQNKGKVN